MIDYELGGWFFCGGLIKCQGSVFPKTLICALPCTVFAILLELYWDAEAWCEKLWTVWSGYSFVLSFLVVFRNNQAYSRFWEGVTLMNKMRGEWFNVCTSLLAFCSAEPEKTEQVVLFQELLVRLMSLLHCSALQLVCKLKDKRLELIDVYGVDVSSLHHIRDASNRCDVLCLWLTRLVLENHLKQVLVAPAPILSRSFQDLGRGRVNLADLVKIRDIPFPFPYAQLIASMLAVHSIITSMITSQFVHPWYNAGCVTFITMSGFWALFYICAEIDHPFGDDPNDLPLTDLQHDWNVRLLELLDPKSQRVPAFTVHTHGMHAARFSITSYLAKSEIDLKNRRTTALDVAHARHASPDIFDSLDDLITHHQSMAGVPPMLRPTPSQQSVKAEASGPNEEEMGEESQIGIMREFRTTEWPLGPEMERPETYPSL
eukprot:s936_g10.t1